MTATSALADALATKAQAWGGWVVGPTILGPETFAAAGYDYVGFDVQHGYLSDADVAALIAEALTYTNAESMRDMGQVMGWLKPKLQGRADMADVSAAVREQLNR